MSKRKRKQEEKHGIILTSSSIIKSIQEKNFRTLEKFSKYKFKVKHTIDIIHNDYSQYIIKQTYKHCFEIEEFSPSFVLSENGVATIPEEHKLFTWPLLFIALKINASFEVIQFIVENNPESVKEIDPLGNSYKSFTKDENLLDLFYETLNPRFIYKDFFHEMKISTKHDVCEFSVFDQNSFAVIGHSDYSLFSDQWNELKTISVRKQSLPIEYFGKFISGEFVSISNYKIKNVKTGQEWNFKLKDLEELTQFNNFLFHFHEGFLFIIDQWTSRPMSKFINLTTLETYDLKDTNGLIKVNQNFLMIASSKKVLYFRGGELLLSQTIDCEYFTNFDFGKQHIAIGSSSGDLFLYSFDENFIEFKQKFRAFEEEIIDIKIIPIYDLVVVASSKRLKVFKIQNNQMFEKYETWIPRKKITCIDYLFGKLIVGSKLEFHVYNIEFRKLIMNQGKLENLNFIFE
jgi:hypothetical protein